MSALFSTFTEVGMVDARNRPGTLTLPLTTQIPYRTLTIKDIYGAANFSTITVQTQGPDVFEDGTTSKLLTDAYETFTVYAGQAGRWYITGGTKIAAMTVGTLNVSTVNGLQNLVSTSYLQTQLGSTVIGLGTAGYLSSAQNLANLVSTANLANHVSTANLANLVSTANLAGHISTANLANLVSTANLVGLVSTANLTSTVIGLGTAGYISSSQLLSTTYGYSQNFITQNASVSSLRFSTATGGNAYISTLTLDQLIFGDGNGWADFAVLRAVAISTLQINTGIIYATTVSTSQIVGVTILSQANLTSTVIGLGTVGYLSSATASINASGLVSTANLVGLVSTANLANLVSTANLANLVSSANLANLISTTYLQTQLGSTVIGLGTA